MSSTRTTCLLLVALFVLSFGLASALEPRFQSLENRHKESTDFFAVLLGNTRFALGGYFYRKADAYYHSGYYPTIFDNNQNFETAHMAEDTGAITSKNTGEDDSFMGPPRDWLDAFSRHFIPNRHTHLDEGGPTGDLSTSSDIDEILPWLKLSTELNPDDVQTYVVTAYWLRQRMNKVSAAEKVLLQGLRYNPDSYEILFELGRLYNESYHDTSRARNVWEAAARKFQKLTPEEQQGDKLMWERITTHLGELELNAGNLQKAVDWFQKAKTVSETPGNIQRQIDEIEKKMAAQPSSGPTNAVH